jgi:hypothetical protein
MIADQNIPMKQNLLFEGAVQILISYLDVFFFQEGER